MEGVVDAVDAAAVKEVAELVEGFKGRVPGDGEHVAFALQEAAGAVLFSGVRTGAAVVFVEFALASGEDVVYVFFDGPGRAHPPAGHLVDDGVGLEDFFNFSLWFVALPDDGLFDGVA